jgi:hypothetical protein
MALALAALLAAYLGGGLADVAPALLALALLLALTAAACDLALLGALARAGLGLALLLRTLAMVQSVQRELAPVIGAARPGREDDRDHSRDDEDDGREQPQRLQASESDGS